MTINYLGRTSRPEPMCKAREFFSTEIQGLIADGYDFCLARIIRDDDSGDYYMDTYLFWTWDMHSVWYKDIDKGFKEASYDEVILNGEGYYLFTTGTEYEYVDEDDGVTHKDYWTYPVNFIKHVTLYELE